MAVKQPLHPEADSSPIGHGEEASLKSSFVKTECSCPVYFLSVGEGFPLQLTDSCYNSGDLRGILAAVQRSYIYVLVFFHHRIIGCLFLQSLLLVALLFFFFA